LKPHNEYPIVRARWRTFGAYSDRVNPSFVNDEGDWYERQESTLLINILSAQSRINAITQRLRSLSDEYATWDVGKIPSEISLVKLGEYVEEICWEAEELFMDYPASAFGSHADDFIHAMSVAKRWETYDREKRYRKLRTCIEGLIKATSALLESFLRTTDATGVMLRDELQELPPELGLEINLARDLFSVNMEEAGAFFCGRGLERVLRTIAKNLRIQVEVKGKPAPLHEMDFADIGEAFRRVRWKKNGNPVIDRELKSLIDLLRTARNAVGHPKPSKYQSSLKRGWREIASLTASASVAIWHESGGGRRKVVPLVLQRDW
jgi:hypothetical protein